MNLFFLVKQLETSVFWATVNTDIPPLSFFENLHSSLVRHIFPSLTCTTTPPLCWNVDAFMHPGTKKKKKRELKKKKKKKKHTHRDPAEDGMTVGCWRTAPCHVNTYNLQSAVRLLINSFPCSYRVDTFTSPNRRFLWSLAEVITRQTAKELFDAVFL